MLKFTQTLEASISITKIAREMYFFLLQSSESPECDRFNAEGMRASERLQMYELMQNL